ncbi:MAG: oxidoreductase [Candidatus Pedobacter colombiensis]|uniref:Oxidoreductase n=1 Tax=Candidatus Pedobacter colombiensis TaxID=3121371 RepID=A0AAJ5W6R2_9SPHI|nr:oxidoreductase [Pedobacter sp.]WEK17577.1 MAG: oxidoreductase [Pedobacter sp.]
MEAIIVGATGLIGSSLLQQLLDHPDYKLVTAVVRREIHLQHPKFQQVVVDFDRLENHQEHIKGDVVFCALGTTQNKTPDKAQYRKIDYQYPLDIALIAQQNGASQYHLVSALGANPNSSIFYSKLKGEVERDLKTIPFKSIHIYRPSLLDGDRQEHRSAEGIMIRLMRVLNPLLIGGLKKYRSIKIEKVASAMLKQSLKPLTGIFTYDSDQIEGLG